MLQGKGRRGRRLLVCACTGIAALAIAAPGASARAHQDRVKFEPCGGQDPTVECTTLKVPLDYDKPDGRRYGFYFARVPATDQANKLGALFINFGGPGGDAAGLFADFGAQIFPDLSARYDIIAFDPRGTGGSQGAIDCKVNQETQGIYSVPFPEPLDLDAAALIRKEQTYVDACLENNDTHLLKHFSTANVARDMNAARRALGLKNLNYYGFSYGTFLGATFASLFPHKYDRMVLDGPLDADQYINDPHQGLEEQTAGFERGLGRFLLTCQRNRPDCALGGDGDPWVAYDKLIERANATPIPADGFTDDPRPVTGDDVITATLYDLYATQYWKELADALAAAEAGDGSGIRALVDGFYERQPDGTFGPGGDRYFVLGAVEQDYDDIPAEWFLKWGNAAWGEFDHFWSNSGYVELNYGLWPIHDRDAFRGPFEVPEDANTPLVVANTYDPATPINGARRLVRDLGNARFLKVYADGHTAYGRTGPCADAAINAYLLDGELPAAGTVCDGEQPFVPPTAAARSATRSSAAADALRRAIARR
jgi:pimeloyl-ACP methyl ester carboxylesterase